MAKKGEARKGVSNGFVSSNDRILVVDDQIDNLILLQEILVEEGYGIELIDNGFDALAAIETSPPDLLLLDLGMPGIDGYEVIRQIRRNSNIPFFPILLMTAHGISYAVHALELGANGCICLPFDVDELLAKVKLFLQLNHGVSSLNLCYRSMLFQGLN